MPGSNGNSTYAGVMGESEMYSHDNQPVSNKEGTSPSNQKSLSVALITGGVALATGIIGFVSQYLTNKQNAAENQKNRDFNASEAEKARQFQLEQWQRQNEYDSPSAQMARFAAAGLNPNLIYSQMGLGTASGASDGNQASSSGSNAYLAPSLGNLAGDLRQSALLDAQIQNIQSDTKQKDKSLEVSDAQIKQMLADAGLKDVTVEEVRTQIDLNRASVDKLRSEISNLDAKTASEWLRYNFDKDTYNKRVQRFEDECKMTHEQAEQFAKIQTATYKNILADTDLKLSSKELNEHQIILTDAEVKVQEALVTYYKALQNKAGVEAAYTNVLKNFELLYGDRIRAGQILQSMTFMFTETVAGQVSKSEPQHYKTAMDNQVVKHGDLTK